MAFSRAYDGLSCWYQQAVRSAVPQPWVARYWPV